MPILINAAAVSSSFNEATLTPALPTGYTTGQLLLLHTCAQMGNPGTPSVTGYTLISPGVHSQQNALFARIATNDSSDQPSFAWTNVSSYALAYLSAWDISPVSIGSLVQASIDFENNNLASGILYQGITVPANNLLILCGGAKNTNLSSITWNAPSGFTIAQHGIQATDVAIVMNYQLQTTATNVSTFGQTQTVNDSSNKNYQSFTLALQTSFSPPGSSGSGSMLSVGGQWI